MSSFSNNTAVFKLKNALVPKSKVCELTGIKKKESYCQLVTTLLKRKAEIGTQISASIDHKIIKNVT